jgi:hypothetical protein
MLCLDAGMCKGVRRGAGAHTWWWCQAGAHRALLCLYVCGSQCHAESGTGVQLYC